MPCALARGLAKTLEHGSMQERKKSQKRPAEAKDPMSLELCCLLSPDVYVSSAFLLVFFLALFPFSDPSEAKIGYQFVLLPFYGCSMFFVLNIGRMARGRRGQRESRPLPLQAVVSYLFSDRNQGLQRPMRTSHSCRCFFWRTQTSTRRIREKSSKSC